MVSERIKSKGLTLAKEKTEAVILTKKHKYDPLKLELEGHPIHTQESLCYLRVWIDKW